LGLHQRLSVTAWLVVTRVHMVESQFFPKFKARWAMGSLGAVRCRSGLVCFPAPRFSAQASAWLPLHWALGLSAYGMFGAAVVHGWMMTRAERDIRLAQDAEQWRATA
jgi:ABC-type uncharacterized transport system permease subunit